MIRYTRTSIVKLLKIDFIRFCVVGGTGFVINFSLLVFLQALLGLPIFLAQLISAEVALFSNFMLHHHWTYKNNKVEKSFYKLLVQFHSVAWPAIVGSAGMVSIGKHFFHLGNFVALVVSSTIVLLWNFVWSKFVIWRDVSPSQIVSP